MKYVDWVEAVLRAAAEELHKDPGTWMVGVAVPTLSRKLGPPRQHALVVEDDAGIRGTAR